ncbi:MAG: hypothetical protein ACRD12_01195 [Acidimicrobiales bacterium]
MGPTPERGGVLLVRVWTETGDLADLRARVVAAQPDLPSQVLATQTGLDGLLEVITAWLEDLTAT